MLLYATSRDAAEAVVRALSAQNIEASGGSPRHGNYPVSVMVSDDRDAEVLGIAKAIDPAIQVG